MTNTKNHRPIVLNCVVMIPFIDFKLNPKKINCYTPAVVAEILSSERVRLYEANGPRLPHEVDPRECYPLDLGGQLLDTDGTIVHYYGVHGQKGMLNISRSVTRVVGATGRNEILSTNGEWESYSLSKANMRFQTESEAHAYIKAELSVPALSRPFQVGDRVRTTRPRINSRTQDFAILTGTIVSLRNGYGWVTCTWDEECNPEGYANRDAYACHGLELVNA